MFWTLPRAGRRAKELPPKHGAPLRVVAEDYYGSDWVKYVDRISVEAT